MLDTPKPPELSDHERRQMDICLRLARADYLAYHPGAIWEPLGAALSSSKVAGSDRA